MTVRLQWSRCQEAGCDKPANFACDHCDTHVCVWHVRVGLPPERPELCERCEGRARRERHEGSSSIAPVPRWLRWLARLLPPWGV